MKTLLITVLFSCAFGLLSMAQENKETIKKEPKIHSTKKSSEKVFPSETERKISEKNSTATQNEESKEENTALPYKSRKITDPKLIEKRKKAKVKKAKATEESEEKK